MPEEPTVENSQIIFEESLIKIRKDLLRQTNGTVYSYYTLITKPASVVVLATTEDGLYILNEEYRHPVGKWLLSCPGGFMNDRETPLEAAKRELLEETGFTSDSFTLMGRAYPYAGISSQVIYYVKAHSVFAVSKATLEPGEIIRIIKKSKNEIIQNIKNKNEIDAHLCAALFYESIIN